MEPITVRFSPEVMRALEQASYDNFLSKAQIVRLATNGQLLQYLREIRIVSPADADAIRAEVKALADATRKAEYELHKIGVNVNQIARALNVMVKSGRPWPKEAAGISLTEQDLLEIIARYEKASKRAGGALCRILG